MQRAQPLQCSRRARRDARHTAQRNATQQQECKAHTKLVKICDIPGFLTPTFKPGQHETTRFCPYTSHTHMSHPQHHITDSHYRYTAFCAHDPRPKRILSSARRLSLPAICRWRPRECWQRSAHAVLFAFDDCDTMIGTIGCDAPIGCVALVGCDVCPTFSAALTP